MSRGDTPRALSPATTAESEEASASSAMPMPGLSTGPALAELERIAAEVLPDGFFIDFSGQSRLEKSEGNTILLAFGAALIVIYLVLAAQFPIPVFHTQGFAFPCPFAEHFRGGEEMCVV